MEKVIKPRISTRRIAVAGVMSAFSILLSLIPSLGYIPVPPLPITITTMHVPVIVAAILEGPVVGAIVGMIFGLSSLYTAATIFAGLPTAFVFLNPLVSVMPRILIGIAAHYAYVSAKKLVNNRSAGIVVGAIAGTLTNTIGVLGMIYLLYAQQYVDAVVKSSDSSVVVTSLFAFIFGGVSVNVIFEILLAAIVSLPVVTALNRIYNGRGGK
ncbi:MAG: ECF transporter S component [Clostridiaceae bacterium]|nr:ECF transporter S component [Clostridiaceae bacterium]